MRAAVAIAYLILVTASVAGPAAAETPEEKRNKEIAIAFYNAALNEKDWEKAKSYIGDTYIQHNQAAVDGLEGIRSHVAMLKERFPQNHGEIKRAFADGDFVILHILSKRSPDMRGNAIVDMFRLKDGKVVEHWDVVQPVPEKAANENGMF
jgi:predicted SnoaL-like aldol condensation-catalyzing enzyme